MEGQEYVERCERRKEVVRAHALAHAFRHPAILQNGRPRRVHSSPLDVAFTMHGSQTIYGWPATVWPSTDSRPSADGLGPRLTLNITAPKYPLGSGIPLTGPLISK